MCSNGLPGVSKGSFENLAGLSSHLSCAFGSVKGFGNGSRMPGQT